MELGLQGWLGFGLGRYAGRGKRIAGDKSNMSMGHCGGGVGGDGHLKGTHLLSREFVLPHCSLSERYLAKEKRIW